MLLPHHATQVKSNSCEPSYFASCITSCGFYILATWHGCTADYRNSPAFIYCFSFFSYFYLATMFNARRRPTMNTAKADGVTLALTTASRDCAGGRISHIDAELICVRVVGRCW